MSGIDITLIFTGLFFIFMPNLSKKSSLIRFGWIAIALWGLYYGVSSIIDGYLNWPILVYAIGMVSFLWKNLRFKRN